MILELLVIYKCFVLVDFIIVYLNSNFIVNRIINCFIFIYYLRFL